MNEIHCHNCGGFITDPSSVSYQAPSAAQPASPHSALCQCIPAVVYGPPQGYVSWPGLTNLARTERSKAAAGN